MNTIILYITHQIKIGDKLIPTIDDTIRYSNPDNLTPEEVRKIVETRINSVGKYPSIVSLTK